MEFSVRNLQEHDNHQPSPALAFGHEGSFCSFGGEQDISFQSGLAKVEERAIWWMSGEELADTERIGRMATERPGQHCLTSLFVRWMMVSREQTNCWRDNSRLFPAHLAGLPTMYNRLCGTSSTGTSAAASSVPSDKKTCGMHRYGHCNRSFDLTVHQVMPSIRVLCAVHEETYHGA